MRPGGIDAGSDETEALGGEDLEVQIVRLFRLAVVEGPDEGKNWQSTGTGCSVGGNSSNDLSLSDPAVSRFHLEIVLESRALRIRDLGSRNGTFVDGVEIAEACLRSGSLIKVGRSLIRVEYGEEQNRLQLSSQTQFGSMCGVSKEMRLIFTQLERTAASDATVLLMGETGTGKDCAAESIHAASSRSDRPFVVVDCGAIPENLLESELFGHERGAFTGATERRVGAFEQASSGTIFLDEIGELPFSLQPKLLRVLEEREVRRVGSNRPIPVDVRVIAATNRDLRREINAGRFRSDLFFRLAVVKVTIPALRDRIEDIPVLVDHILASLGGAQETEGLRSPTFVSRLRHASWPGNIRQLRNYLEECLVLREEMPMPHADGFDPTQGSRVDEGISYSEGRRVAIASFEKRYIEALLRRHEGRVVQAARAAGINRVHLFRLARRHGIKGNDPE